MSRDNLRQAVIDREMVKGGLRSKINAMCASCIYDPDAMGTGTWRQQVEGCTSKNCPLYAVRPVSSAKTG